MTPDGRTIWTDARLDDLHSELLPLRGLLQTVAKHDLAIENNSKDIDGLGNKIQTFILEQREAERDRIRERKADRRWLVGTVLTSAALVIAALGLLLDKF